MTTVERHADCQNSPKNQWVQELAIALEDGSAARESLSDTVEWHGLSEGFLKGPDAVTQQLHQHPKPERIRVIQAISHGKVGMAHGETQFNDGKIRRFCHVFEFTNTKATALALIRTYA